MIWGKDDALGPEVEDLTHQVKVRYSLLSCGVTVLGP